MSASGRPTPASKRVDAAEAVRDIPAGATVGIGGMMLSRRPTGLCRQLSRSGVDSLTLVGLSGGFETDALVGLDLVDRVRMSFVTFGIFGLAPMFQQAVETGRIEQPYETEMSIVAGLRASMARTGFFPFHGWDETDFLEERPDVQRITCPYSGDEYVAFPAIDIDVALLHVPIADEQGSAQLGADAVVDIELARAAELTILSAERIVPAGTLPQQFGTDVSHFDVDLVCELPGGARPASCAQDYGIDAALLIDYLHAVERGEGAEMLERWREDG